MKRVGRKTRLLFLSIVAFLAVWLLVFLLGFRFVLERSMQPGLYRYVEGDPVRGGFVAFHLSEEWSDLALERGYLKHGSLHLRERPTIKHVAASQGDRMKVDSSGIWVNGNLLDSSKALDTDSKGRDMPKFFLHEAVLKEGEFLVISHNKTNGLDSRYYGVLNDGNLISKVVPIFYF